MTNASLNSYEADKLDSQFPVTALLGLVLFALTLPANLMADDTVSVILAAVTLALIGGAYVGFGTADGRPRVFWHKLIVALLFGMAAVTGPLRHWTALCLSLLLHGVWNIANHNSRYLAKVPRWYIPRCDVYDLLLAGFLVLLFTV